MRGGGATAKRSGEGGGAGGEEEDRDRAEHGDRNLRNPVSEQEVSYELNWADTLRGIGFRTERCDFEEHEAVRPGFPVATWVGYVMVWGWLHGCDVSNIEPEPPRFRASQLST